MDRFRQIEAFVSVAEQGSFNGAARQLALSPSIVTRLVNGLEERLGTRLFARTTRRVSLTEPGERFLFEARHVLESLRQAEDSAAGAHQRARGELRITAPVLFGERVIAPILRDFLDEYPDVSVRTLFVDRIVHLLEEGVDIAVRLADLPDSSLTAIRVGTVRRVVVASPAYLKANGTPVQPDQLEAHRIINNATLERPKTWTFQARGKTHLAHVNPRLTVNTVQSAIDAAEAGWGICRALSYQVDGLLREGRLVELLTGWDDRIMPVHLVHQEGSAAPARIRAFLDFAGKRLRSGSHALRQ